MSGLSLVTPTVQKHTHALETLCGLNEHGFSNNISRYEPGSSLPVGSPTKMDTYSRIKG